MSFYQNQFYNHVDQETTQKIFDRLIKEPELAQTLYGLYCRVMEMNPGERFTRYAKRENREKPIEKLPEQIMEKLAENVPTKPLENTGSNPVELPKKKKSLVLSKQWNKPVVTEEVVIKKGEFVVDNHKKVIDKFKEMQSQIKPHPTLVTFHKIPILDTNRKPGLEEGEFTKIRKASFNRHH